MPYFNTVTVVQNILQSVENSENFKLLESDIVISSTFDLERIGSMLIEVHN